MVLFLLIICYIFILLSISAQETISIGGVDYDASKVIIAANPGDDLSALAQLQLGIDGQDITLFYDEFDKRNSAELIDLFAERFPVMSHPEYKFAALDFMMAERQLLTAERNKQILGEAKLGALQRFVNALMNTNCLDGDATARMKRHLASEFSEAQHKVWAHPQLGVHRSSVKAFVPCPASGARGGTNYWVGGEEDQDPEAYQYHVLPMPAHCCNKDVSVTRCPARSAVTAASFCAMDDALGVNEARRQRCQDDGTVVCLDYMRRGGVVYTFGIAGEWGFEDYAAQSLGNTVHAFDPTKRFLERHLAHDVPGVSFHYMGLKGYGRGNAVSHGVQGYYGALEGEMLTLGEIVDAVNGKGAAVAAKQSPPVTYVNQSMSMIKIDCEGCEWESFHQIASETPRLLDTVCTIIIEVHVVTTLKMETVEQLEQMAFFWEYYVEKLGFRLWYLHTNPGGPRDRRVNSVLLDLGLEPDVCCYEIGFHRPNCVF
jgi:hypothetical protein